MDLLTRVILYFLKRSMFTVYFRLEANYAESLLFFLQNYHVYRYKIYS